MPKDTGVKKYKNNQARHSGVILERMEGKIDLLIDQQNGMKENFSSRFDSIENKVNKLVTDVDVIKLDGVVIKDNIKKKIDVTEIAALRRRVTVLEGSK